MKTGRKQLQEIPGVVPSFLEMPEGVQVPSAVFPCDGYM